MRVINCRNNEILAFGNNAAHYLSMNSSNGLLLKQIEFDNAKEIVDCVFLKNQEMMLVTHEESIATYSINMDQAK